MCSAMVASVPMPLVSMSAMRSDSESRGGAQVLDSRRASTLGSKLMPGAKSGRSLPSQRSHTNTYATTVGGGAGGQSAAALLVVVRQG